MQAGDELIVETTDPLAGIDIPHFCHEDGHELLAQEQAVAGKFRGRQTYVQFNGRGYD